MGGTEDYATIRDLDLLRAESQRERDILRNRIEQMDAQGTRGVGIIVNQVSELVKDFSDLKAESARWQAGHEAQHNSEARDRIVGRRWLVGIGIAGLASMAAVITMLVDVVAQVHGG